MIVSTTSSRRFLTTSLAGAVSLPAWSAPLGANGDVRVALIGFRGRGSGHIKELLKVPGVRLVALCDADQAVIDKKVADLAKDNIQVKTYRDFRECCADKDIDSIRARKYTQDVLHIRHGHHAACLAHLANVFYRLGIAMKADEINERLQGDKFGQELFAEFLKNLTNNGIDLARQPITVGRWLDFDPATHQFTGEFAAEANKLCVEDNAAGFELPDV